MNDDEAFAHDYLHSCGHQQIVFEPNGNKTPDFSINGNIACEVRRLNPNYFGNDGVKGLEDNGKALVQTVENIVNKFSYQQSREHYHVSLRYRRPFGISMKRLRRELVPQLQNFLDLGGDLSTVIYLSDTIQLRFLRATNITSQFLLSGLSDHDNAGWVYDHYLKNIRHCIDEKTSKLRKYLQKDGQHGFACWWLVLVDHLGPLNAKYARDISTALELPPEWERLIVISKRSNKIVIDLKNQYVTRQ